MLVGQEVKRLDDNSGLVKKQTFGKTLRGYKHKSHVFVIKKCRDKTVCPVTGLHTYVQDCKRMGVYLANGFLFQVVLENGRVIGDRVTYSVMYERLIRYITLLGIYEGETPHSFRVGCAVTLALSGSVANVGQIMNHVGW